MDDSEELVSWSREADALSNLEREGLGRRQIAVPDIVNRLILLGEIGLSGEDSVYLSVRMVESRRSQIVANTT